MNLNFWQLYPTDAKKYLLSKFVFTDIRLERLTTSEILTNKSKLAFELVPFFE